MQMVIKERATLGESTLGFFLLMGNYRRKGYISFSWLGLCTLLGRFICYLWKVHKLNLDPSKGHVTIAKENNHVVGTVCVECNPTTTPIDKIFPNEMARFYTNPQPFAYLGSLAVASRFTCTRLCFKMLKSVKNTIEVQGIQTVIFVVHPNHVTFYQRFGCELVAIATNMSGLSQAPAALLILKVKESCCKA